MRQITQSRRLAEVKKKKKFLPPLAGVHDPIFNNGDRHYCARPETDFFLKKKKGIKENRKRIHGENCHTSEMQQSNSLLTSHIRRLLKF